MAQTEIRGTVYNSTGELLPFAALFLKKSKMSSTSKIDGSFSIFFGGSGNSFSDTLVCSYVGYEKFAKQIQIVSGKSVNVEVVLNPKYNVLPEFEFVEFSLSADEIIKSTIKSTKDNYIREPTQSSGFYREMIYEDDEPIELHETLLKMNHAPYPKTGFTKRAFKQYWDRSEFTMTFGFSVSDVFRHVVYFPGYVHPEDNIEINAVRSSNNLSTYGINAAPVGGPLDLVALDKIKYRYDFLDSKLSKQYAYEKTGYLEYKGKRCVIIGFRPKSEYQGALTQPFNQKQQNALYQGELYISIESFALLKIKAQLSSGTNFSVYQGNPFIPYFVEFDVDYTTYNGRLILTNVLVSQSNIVSIGSDLVNYKAVRQLSLGNFKEPEYQFNKDYLIPIQHFTSLKYFNLSYSREYWEEFSSEYGYSAPPPKFLTHIGHKIPLSIQFESKNYPIDSISVPLVESIENYELLTGKNQVDYSDSNYQKVLEDFSNIENLYSEQVFNKLLPERKRFYYQYFNLYPKDSLVNLDVGEDEYRWQQNEIGDIVLIYTPSENGQGQVVFNYSRMSLGKSNFQLDDVTHNESKSYIICSYMEGGKPHLNLAIQNRSQETMEHLRYVSEFEFLNDSSVLYTRLDSITYRVKDLYIHRIGSVEADDVLIFEEKDSSMGLFLHKSSSKEFFFLRSESKTWSKNYLLEMQEDHLELKELTELSESRTSVDHFGGSLIYTYRNSLGENSVGTLVSGQTIFDVSKIIYTTTNPIVDLQETSEFVVVAEYKYNSLRLKVIDKESNNIQSIQLPDSVLSLDFMERDEFWSNNEVVINYQTPVSPFQRLRINLNDGSIYVEDEILIDSTVFKKNYQCDLIWYKNPEGTLIPVTILYEKSWLDGDFIGMVVKAYGAYGALNYPSFNEEDFIYAHQGILVAFVHVRGGSDLGLNWYYQGKQHDKINSMEDFIGATNYLQEHFKIEKKHTIGIGTSAGGVIMGYVANTEPELCGGLILDRPFLDLINTLKDPMQPLSQEEYLEWGNPNDSISLSYILDYSPYQNINQAQKYPHMFYISKYRDVQSPAWQIASSVAKLRSKRQNDRLLLLCTDFNSGHNGSANFEIQVDEMANKYAFIMYVLEH